MCGFAALIQNKRQFELSLLDAIDRDLYHRGPDSSGLLNEPGCALIFRRLSIIDPSPEADQPMTNSSGRYAIVFNGEIYNFKILRDELISVGINFRTQSDTEVLLNGYIYWGDKIVDKLEGMYAFVIWDRKQHSVFAARDPHGIKPLYCARTEEFVCFASEARPLRRIFGTTVDPAALQELLLFRFAAGRSSNLLGIELIPGGTTVTFDSLSNTYTERCFCNVLDTLQPELNMSEEKAVKISEASILQSVQVHLQSDVDYAVQLSGGIDSSLVAVLAAQHRPNRLRTFGINLGNIPQDEKVFRQALIDRYPFDHHEVALSSTDFANAFPSAISYMEGPSAHFGCVMLMLLCSKIRETDKVVLTGEGADEFFGGYARYGQWEVIQRHSKIAKLIPRFLWPLLKRYRGIQRYADYDPAVISSVYCDFFQLNQLFPDLFPFFSIRNFSANRFTDFRDRMMAVDQTAYLSSLLMRQDKMAMAASVESRVPFTHLPVTRIVNSIPQRLRVPGGSTKKLLKKVAAKYLPSNLINRRKVGLTLPIGKWLKDEKGLGRYLEDLSAPNSRLAAYADRPILRRMISEFRSSESGSFPLLANLVNMEVWLRSLDSLDVPSIPKLS